MTGKKYQVKVTYPSGFVAMLMYRDKTSWCKRQAQHHIDTYAYWHGVQLELVDA